MLLQTLHAITVAMCHQTQVNTDSSFLGTKPSNLFWTICLNPAASLHQTFDKRQSSQGCPSSHIDAPSLHTPDAQCQHDSKRPFTSAPALPVAKPTSSMPMVSNRQIKEKIESLCDLLVPYVHRDGSLSWVSRDALLLLTATSCTDSIASYHITKHSSLCEVSTFYF